MRPLSGKRSCARPRQLVEKDKGGSVPYCRLLVAGLRLPALTQPPSHPGEHLETPPHPHSPPPAPKSAPHTRRHPLAKVVHNPQ